jgi:hypothetical protein
MAELLIILQLWILPADLEAVMRVAPATQMVSSRVFLANLNPEAVAQISSMPGIAAVLTGAERNPSLPALDEAESLFVRAWLSRQGVVKQRRGEGWDWDTPPMQPPDRLP